MELCGANMNEGGASLCRLKQLKQLKPMPSHCSPICRLQAGGTAGHIHALAHQPRVTHADPALVSGAAVAVRHRVHTAAADAGCTGPQGVAPGRGEDSGASREKALVTGGAGYVGFSLGRTLARWGVSVILLDVNRPPSDVPDGTTFFQGDIRDYASLFKACEGVDCIFHTASYGMSGPEQLKKEQVESINVGGTRNVIKVCKERSIPRLVYTSTINAVFAEEPIEDGDEASVPYVLPDVHVDHYSRTKAAAEKMVLSADGCCLKGGGRLRTCALRPCGIYGPGERNLHRVMVNVERRLFSFRFGDPQAKMNWVHIDNLVQAHGLAAEALTQKRSCVASGQVYFINDGVSVNLFQWLTPVFEQLGCSRPLIKLPVTVVYAAVVIMEYLHLSLRPVLTVPLLFTRSEELVLPEHILVEVSGPAGDSMTIPVNKTLAAVGEHRKFKKGFTGSDLSTLAIAMVMKIALTNTFKIDKALQELGYRPKTYHLSDSVEEYLKHRKPRSESPPSKLLPPHVLLMLLAVLGLVLLMLSCLFC